MKNSLLLVLALIFVSGCVGTAKVDINNGVVIERFVADPTDVFDFQTVTFSADVSNLGGTTANDVKIKLLGVEGAWRPQSGSGTVSESQVTKPTVSLKPPSVKNNIPGDSRFFDFTLTAPNLNEGDKTSFPVKARVEFSYATTGTVIVKAISLNQQQILQRKGESVLEPVKESNSDSPVKFSFVRGPAPFVIDPDEGSTVEREFRFEISNVGDGWPISDDVVGKVGGSKGSKIELLAPTGISLTKCEGFTTGNQASFSAILRSDGKAPISCTISVATARFTTTTEVSLVFNVELNYKYFVEKEVSVGVQGTTRGDVSKPAPGVATPTPGATPVPGTTPVSTASVSIATSQTELSWYKENFFVKLTFNDPSGLSNRKCQYLTPGKSDWQTVSCSGTTDSRDVQINLASGGDCPSEGTCTVRARITDTNNIPVSSITEKNFNIDRISPLFTSDVTADKTTINANEAVTYSATVTDATSQIKVCSLFVDDAPQGAMTISGTSTSKSYTKVTAGTFTIKIQCDDNAGNRAEKSKQFTAQQPTPTPTPA